MAKNSEKRNLGIRDNKDEYLKKAEQIKALAYKNLHINITNNAQLIRFAIDRTLKELKKF